MKCKGMSIECPANEIMLIFGEELCVCRPFGGDRAGSDLSRSRKL